MVILQGHLGSLLGKQLGADSTHRRQGLYLGLLVFRQTVLEGFRNILFLDFHDAGYRGYSVWLTVLVKGLLEGGLVEERCILYMRSRSRPRLCNLRPGVLCLIVGGIVAAMRQVHKPFQPCSIRRSC